MFKVIRLPVVSRLIASVILGPFLIMTNGCHYLRVHTSAEPYTTVIPNMQDEQKFIILHLDDNVWHFTDIKVDERNVSGKISKLKGHEVYKRVTPDAPVRYRNTAPYFESGVLNEVHIYVTEMEMTDQINVTIPDTAIQKIEIYDKATGAVVASWVFPIVGLAVAAFGVVLIIALLTSCPFVYTYDSEDYVFSGEIFSGAVQPGLERDDYLPLTSIFPGEESYKIKITNELREVQYINLAELLLISHEKGTTVLIDKNGVPYSVNEPRPPISAMTGDKTDILQLVKEKDSLNYTGIEGVVDKSGIQDVILEFARPDNATSAQLVIRAKNSLWLEAVSAKVREMFGERYSTFSSKQEKVSVRKMTGWQLDQNIPLSVFIEKDGRWDFVDYFNLAGPMTMRDDVLAVKLEGSYSDTVRIRLRTGFLFWEIDYAALDFSSDESLEVLKVPASSATDNNNVEVQQAVSATDDEYFILDKQGDDALLVFGNPQLQYDSRSVFLHSRGYYKVIADQTGAPDKKTLRTFRKPGRMPSFSKETYDMLK